MARVAHFVTTPTVLILIFNEYEKESLRNGMIGPRMPHIQQLKMWPLATVNVYR